MGEHVALDMERLIRQEPTSGQLEEEVALLKQMVECRICQEEDSVENLESPCACSGSLKYAHRTCVQRWCNEKGDINCEICHESYRPDYSALSPCDPSETTIEIRGGWPVTGVHADLHDPSFLSMAQATQRHFLEEEYDEYASTSSSAAASCRSIFLILMAFLLLRHTLSVTNDDDEEDASTLLSLFLLRAAGFLLPCYIMTWAITILQRQRQTQEAVIPDDRTIVQFDAAPASASSPHHEAHD